MPCYQPTSLPSGITTAGRTGYATEAECLQACKEGACCEGTTCSVKPQCQCQGTGKTFRGVGTTCSGVSCCRLQLASECQSEIFPQQITAAIELSQQASFSLQSYYNIAGSYTLALQSSVSQGVCAYYFASAQPSVVAAINVQYLLTQSSGAWVRAVALDVRFSFPFGGSNDMFAFPSGGPCVSGGYIAVSGCLAATATLYQDAYLSTSVPCGQRWRNAGTITVTA